MPPAPDMEERNPPPPRPLYPPPGPVPGPPGGYGGDCIMLAEGPLLLLLLLPVDSLLMLLLVWLVLLPFLLLDPRGGSLGSYMIRFVRYDKMPCDRWISKSEQSSCV